MTKDVTSVRDLFRSVFTAVKDIGGSEVSTMSEMAYTFGKRQPVVKGYEFLTKPYITEEMSGLNLKEVMTALFTYEDSAAN